MGDHQHGRTQIIDLLQQCHNLKRTRRIQIAGGLVGDDGGRVVHQSAGNGQTLLLTAGQFARMTAALSFQPHQIQNVGNTILDLLIFGTHNTHGEGHIIVNRHIVDQAEILEHDSHRSAQIRNLPFANPLQGIAVDMNRAGGRLQLSGDQLNDRGLTGTGGADQETEFAVLDLHGNTLQCLSTHGVFFCYIVKFYHGSFSIHSVTKL